MFKKMRCPECGWEVGFLSSRNDFTEEQMAAIMTCQCGARMDEVDKFKSAGVPVVYDEAESPEDLKREISRFFGKAERRKSAGIVEIPKLPDGAVDRIKKWENEDAGE